MNEKELDELLNIESDCDESQKDLTKALKRSISRQIYKRVIAVLVIIAIGITILYKGSSFVVDKVYYDPTDEKGYFSEDEYCGSNYGAFEEVLSEYVGLYYSGQQVNVQLKKADGFGRYSYEIYMGDYKWNSDACWYDFDVCRNKITTDNENEALPFMTTGLAGKFRGYADKNNDIIDDIKATPDSACFRVSVSFENSKNADEIANFINTYYASKGDDGNECEILWVATAFKDGHDDDLNATGMSELYDTGISLYKLVSSYYSDKFNENYPGISDDDMYFGNNITGEKLTQKYLSSMKLILDNKEVFDMVNEYEPDVRYNRLKEQYDYVSENGFNAIGVTALVDKATLLKMMEEDAFQYTYVDDAVFSSLGAK